MVDANVLIDYLAADATVLRRVSQRIGPLHIPRQILQEVPRLDAEICEHLELRIVDEYSGNAQVEIPRLARAFFESFCATSACDSRISSSISSRDIASRSTRVIQECFAM